MLYNRIRIILLMFSFAYSAYFAKEWPIRIGEERIFGNVSVVQHPALITADVGNGTAPINASCPEIVSRAEWNARDPVYNNETESKVFLKLPLHNMVYTQTYTGTTAHGTCTDRESCKLIVKAIQNDHMGFGTSTDKFADIGYHFLIGVDGSIFEGRGWLVRAAYYKQYNDQGFGVAFLGTFPLTGTSVAPLTYEAILSAHQLLRCAISQAYLISPNYTLVSLRLSPTVGQYIDNPDSFPHDSPTDAPALKPAEVAAISIGCSIALAFGIALAISSWRKARISTLLPDEEPLVPTTGDTPEYQSLDHGPIHPRSLGTSTDGSVDAYETLGSDCLYRYSLSEKIGGGSFGTVYKARITHRGTYSGQEEAAVKVLHIQNLDEMENPTGQFGKFKDKWKMLIEFNCENLVAYHKITISQTETGSFVEILMDYCNGRDMEQLLSRIKSSHTLLDRATALCYALQIVNGVDYLHQRQLMHGDLKPGNIFVRYHTDRHYAVIIGDLDCLVHMSHNTISATHRTNILGTAKYMSPERVHWDCHDELQIPSRKADIWSVGCIMHDLFDYSCGIFMRMFHKAGSRPEESETFLVEKNTEAQVIIMRIMNGYVPFVSKMLPPELSSVISRCLIVASNERPSAAELQNSLLALLGHITTHRDPAFVTQKDVIRHCVCGKQLYQSEYGTSWPNKTVGNVSVIPYATLAMTGANNGTVPSNASCPAIVTRAEWNARDPIYSNETETKVYLKFPLPNMVYTQTYTGTSLHGTCADVESCKFIVKTIQNDHMGFAPASTNKLADISYHFLIGINGSIFEGRGWFVGGAYYKPFNDQGFGVAFLGTFPPAGTSVAPLTYEAILAAHQLLRCAISLGHLISPNYTLLSLRITPTVGRYIDNPDTFPHDSPTDAPALKPEETIIISFGCSVALALGITLAVCGWRKARMFRLQPDEEPLAPALERAMNYHSLDHGPLHPRTMGNLTGNAINVYESLGSDCLYQYSLSEKIGGGSFGTVYKARITHRGTYTGDEEAAVKVLHIHNTDDVNIPTEEFRKFRDKWKMLLDFNSEHLVAYHKISISGTETGSFVEILMDYCSGRDLEQLLSRIKINHTLIEPRNRAAMRTADCYGCGILTRTTTDARRCRITPLAPPIGPIFWEPRNTCHQNACTGIVMASCRFPAGKPIFGVSVVSCTIYSITHVEFIRECFIKPARGAKNRRHLS
ncbi:uncharacterized protein LOC129592265 [Paramacrobiotus metropolitanus]|uniref:uncharacterized protein LOC129592265 n=1 Tax=Paramacrobiotus metropolitanus TaxID=2943436 RepID=UPI0024458693|nr:uncharacterized protein LOC129592265 [Paramacrobiotus metropolitanus]